MAASPTCSAAALDRQPSGSGSPPAGATGILAAAGLAVRSDGHALLVTGAADPAMITKVLAEQGRYVAELSPVLQDLESVFLEITEGEGL